MKKFLDWHFYNVNFISIAVLVLSILWIKLCNISIIYENSIYENIAIIPLTLGIIYCLKEKNHKVLFRMIAMVLFLAIAREFSYGRVPFAQMPDNPHNYYSWSHYKYGWLAHVIIGIYIAAGFLYGIVNKFWLDVKEVFKKVPIPVWSFILTFIYIIIQMYDEKVLETSLIEEVMELSIYCMTFAIVYIYYKKLQES
ncbi:hypothetical protein II906_12740 [bacterium]|nr:hypothetical protein [bacterium]